MFHVTEIYQLIRQNIEFLNHQIWVLVLVLKSRYWLGSLTRCYSEVNMFHILVKRNYHGRVPVDAILLPAIGHGCQIKSTSCPAAQSQN